MGAWFKILFLRSKLGSGKCLMEVGMGMGRVLWLSPFTNSLLWQFSHLDSGNLDNTITHPQPQFIKLIFPTHKPLPEAVGGGPGRAAGQTTSAETPGREGSGWLLWGQGTRWRSRISEDSGWGSPSSIWAPSGKGKNPSQKNKPGQGCRPAHPPDLHSFPSHTPDQTGVVIYRPDLLSHTRPVDNFDLESQNYFEIT